MRHNIALEKQIEGWVSANLKHVSLDNPVSIHIDMLVGKEVERSQLIPLSIEAFIALVKRIRKLQIPIQPTLAIPLVTLSNRVEMAAPHNLETLESQLPDRETPSLYLLDPNTWRGCENYEEYKAPLGFSLLARSTKGIYFCYRELRDGLAIKNNWEFARAVYAEFYPELTSTKQKAPNRKRKGATAVWPLRR